MSFTGSLVAIITPFRNGKVDEKALGDLIEWQIANGTDGIVPCGTTGESATLTHEEHKRVVEFTVQVVRRRVPVIAGTGSNSTDEAIEFTRHAKSVGADAAPAEMSALVDAWAAGDAAKARAIHYQIYPLFQALFLETNPIPIKHAVALMGKATAELRLPHCPMSQENLDKLTRVMKDLKLI